MALTPDERKGKLGTGGLAKIARRLRLSKGHVSQVNSGTRPDPKVERAITRDIVRKWPDLNAADIWPQRRAS